MQGLRDQTGGGTVFVSPKNQMKPQQPQQLLPLADSMDDMLHALRDVPFSTDQDSLQGDRRSTQDRSEALSTLMTVLSDQAEKDGFRLITINTEPKRVIMACNRQGKPPVTVAEPTNSSDESAVDQDGNPVQAPKKNNTRQGSSVRCGCRMRININFHSKLNSWRITSFEHEHNHEFGNGIEVPKSGKRYEISPYMVERAINRFKGLQSPPMANRVVNREREDDAAITLAGLVHSPSVGHSPSKSHLSIGKTPAVANMSVGKSPKPPKIMIVRQSPPKQLVSPYGAAGPSFAAQQQLQQNRRRSISDPHHPVPMNATTPRMMSFEEASGVKNFTGMAVEIDRYAMLHSQFKKLIAVACKKREFTEEVLSNIGRMMDHIQAPNVFAQQLRPLQSPLKSPSPVKREGSPLSPITSKLARMSPIREKTSKNSNDGYHLTPLKLSQSQQPKLVAIMSPLKSPNSTPKAAEPETAPVAVNVEQAKLSM